MLACLGLVPITLYGTCIAARAGGSRSGSIAQGIAFRGKSTVVENTTTAVRTCQLLYYGAATAGKRENLALVHRTIPPESRLNLAAEDPERQIAFIYKQPDGETWQVLVQAVDAGRERPRTAGMSERTPFDAVVFTVDSGAAQLDQSLSSFEALKAYLDSWGRDLMDVPVVIQYNRRTAPDALPVDRLESLLNPWGLLSYPADSARGEGVKETLKSALGLAINHLKSLPEPLPEPIVPMVEQRPQPTMTTTDPEATEKASNIDLDYGPPVPGVEVEALTMARGDSIMDHLRPSIVVPVTIPRKLLTGEGPVQVLLEVTIGDDDRF